MNRFIKKLNAKLLSEDVKCPCKMFWCIPSLNDSNVVEWEPIIFDADGDDLSNWIIVIHKLKKAWETNFDACKNSHSGLPRGVMVDGVLYHGNNLPSSISLSSVATMMGGKLGTDITPMYNKQYGISQEDLSKIEDVIGRELGLQCTD